MTLLTALKSNKIAVRNGLRLHAAYKGSFNLLVEELLADDWEIEEESITITKSNLVKVMESMRDLGIDSVEARASELFRRFKE